MNTIIQSSTVLSAQEATVEKTLGSRLLYVDVLRCVGTCAVIVTHASYKLFYKHAELPLHKWLAIIFWGSSARWAVPIFFMISGMLLLNANKQDSIKTILLKRVPRLLLPLFLWSEIYLLWINRNNIINHQPIPFVEGLRWMYKAPVFLHLWFLYTLIGIYLAIPLVRLISKNATAQVKRHFLICWFVTNGVFGMINFFYDLKLGIELPLFNIYLGYFILGSWVEQHEFTQRERRAIIWTTGLSLVTIFYGTYYLKSHGLHLEWFYDYSSIPVIVASIGLFITARYLPWNRWIKPNSWSWKLIKEASALTFGVYLSHVLVLEFLEEGFIMAPIDANSIHPFLGIPVLSLGILIFCLLLAKLLRLIPVLRWLTP